MIHLVYSNRVELLAKTLARQLARRTDPYRTLTVLVPNRVLERWLEMRLAEHLGIAANLRFERLEKFVYDAFALRGEILTRPVYEGRILRVLTDETRLATREYESLRSYIEAGGDEPFAIATRCAQLARRLASLFEDYATTRVEMLQAWERGDRTTELELEVWQAALWRDIRATGGRTLVEAIQDAPRVPPLVDVFGFSYVSRAFQTALAKIAQSSELRMYSLNPCKEFWEDALSDREARRARRSIRAAEGDPFALLAENDNPLLRSWGRPGREHIALLDELTGFSASTEFWIPEPDSTLHRVQRAILDRAPIERREPDSSVSIIAAPSVRRELETIASMIWSVVAKDEIRFHEIGVAITASERERYLPQLESVFAEARELPWNAADLALTLRSHVADCALRLLALPAGRFGRGEVLEVITHPLVLRRFPEVEPTDVARLCDRLGVFFGVDDADHQGTYLEGSSAVHWEQAVQRLALGAWMEAEPNGIESPFEVAGRRLFPEPIATSDELGRGLGLLIRSLAADLRFARDAKLSPGKWSQLFAAMLRSYLIPADGSEETELRSCLRALHQLEQRETAPESALEISYPIALELARAELESLSALRGEPLGQGVAVTTIMPMRPIPFRVLFVAGLGEGRFPLHQPESGLDLRGRRRESGDVDSEERDRYAFLETLLSARERVVLSYVARDEHTGESREPSTVVVALEEAIGAPLPRETPALRRHELRTADPIVAHVLPGALREAQAREAGSELRSRRGGEPYLERKLVELGPHDEYRTLLDLPNLPEAPEVSTHTRISITQLRRFLECPIQGHASLMIAREEASFDRDEEPFEASRVVRETVLIDSFAAAMRGSDPEQAYESLVARAKAKGRWPLSALAELHRESDEAALKTWLTGLRHWPDKALTRYRFGVGTELHGWIPEVPKPAISIPLSNAPPIEIVGRTQMLSASFDSVMPTTKSLDGEGEPSQVEVLGRALRAFVDHAILSAAGLSNGRTRRAWILDLSSQGPLAIQLLPIEPEMARRWLAYILDDLLYGKQGLYLPVEAVLRREKLFRYGGDNASEELARSIEEVRTKSPWNGGSSQWGPVRDAIEYPPPEPREALSMASRRFRVFFDSYKGARRANG